MLVAKLTLPLFMFAPSARACALVAVLGEDILGDVRRLSVALRLLDAGHKLEVYLWNRAQA